MIGKLYGDTINKMACAPVSSLCEQINCKIANEERKQIFLSLKDDKLFFLTNFKYIFFVKLYFRL